MEDPLPQLYNISLSLFKPMSPETWVTVGFLILGLAICLSLSIICASAENAFFSHKENDLEQLRNGKSKITKNIINILSQPKHFLATVLIFNSLGLIGFVVLAEFLFESIMHVEQHPVFKFVLDAIVVTLVILIFGEVMPKVYATHHYRSTAKVLAIPLRIMMTLSWPLTQLLVKTTGFIEKRVNTTTPELSADELSEAIEITADKEDVTQEKEILKGIVQIGRVHVSQIMRPRMDVIALDENWNFLQVLKIVEENRFSRLPVFKDNLDNITGILFIKDLLPYLQQSSDFEWKALTRPAYFVPESKKIDDLLHEFRQSRNHMAIVVDEFGGSNGIVTLEDILEEVFGEMYDEFDDELEDCTQINENTWQAEAKFSQLDFLKMAKLPLDYFDEINEENDTLGGIVTEIEGNIPKKNQKINFKELTFTIEASDLRKVKRLTITLNKNQGSDIDE